MHIMPDLQSQADGGAICLCASLGQLSQVKDGWLGREEGSLRKAINQDEGQATEQSKRAPNSRLLWSPDFHSVLHACSMKAHTHLSDAIDRGVVQRPRASATDTELDLRG